MKGGRAVLGYAVYAGSIIQETSDYCSMPERCSQLQGCVAFLIPRVQIGSKRNMPFELCLVVLDNGFVQAYRRPFSFRAGRSHQECCCREAHCDGAPNSQVAECFSLHSFV